MSKIITYQAKIDKCPLCDGDFKLNTISGSKKLSILMTWRKLKKHLVRCVSSNKLSETKMTRISICKRITSESSIISEYNTDWMVLPKRKSILK